MIEIKSILETEQFIGDLDAVIFDLDDTLYSEKEYVRSGYRKIAKYFKIPQMENEMWIAFQNGRKAIDDVLTKHGMLSQKEQALQIYQYHKPEISLYPGVSEMLIRISKDKKVGIITDGRPEGQQAKLKSLKLAVDQIIITDELGSIEYRKPNPKAFELMLEVLNVKPEKSCYVGDNIIKDFLAPKKLDMRCIWYNNPDGLYYR